MRKKRRITKTAMVKKWFLFLAITAGLVTSCKNYDDDIDNLQEQIDVITSDLGDIQDLVDAGKFVQTVTTQTNGILITFSDGSTATITNGTNGTDGTSSVLTIVDGYWYLNGVTTEVKAAGEDGEDGSVVTIGTDGYWYIDGVKTTVLANPGSIVAVENAAETYYTLAVINQDGTAKSIVVPVVAQHVSSIVFVPEYMSPLLGAIIYAPILSNDENGVLDSTYFGKSQILYQINPSSVQRESFDVVGLFRSDAILIDGGIFTRASDAVTPDVPVTVLGYERGTLEVSAPTATMYSGILNYLMGEKEQPKISYFSLAVKNNSEEGEEDAEEYVFSSLIPAMPEILNIQNQVYLTKTKADEYAELGQDPDWTVVFDNTAGTTIDVASWFRRYQAHIALEDFFDVSYAFDLPEGYADNQYFTFTGNTIAVKDQNPDAVGKTAWVNAFLIINEDTVKVQNINIAAVRETTNKTVYTETVNYVRGSALINVDSYNEDLFTDEMGATMAATATVTNTFKTGADIDAAGISFNATDELNGEDVVLEVLASVEAGSYTATRTYTTADGNKFSAVFTINITDAGVDLSQSYIDAFWDTTHTTEIIYGTPDGTTGWNMTGDMADGFNQTKTTLTGEPTVGTLTIAGYSYAIDGTYPGVTISDNVSGTISVDAANANTYVDGAPVKVLLNIEISNGFVYSHSFNVVFKSPVKVETGSLISFVGGTTITKTPWDGVKLTNIRTGTVLSTAAERAQYNITVAPSVQVDDATYDPSDRLTVNWTAGTISWQNDGVVLQQDLKTAYDITFNFDWGQAVKLEKGLKITVQPPVQ